MNANHVNYTNTEIKTVGGVKTVRKVSVKKGKGYKQVIQYRGGKKISSVKKLICNDHIQKINNGKFIAGLFSDCKTQTKRKTKNNKTRKIR
jgi:hypothetical protein